MPATKEQLRLRAESEEAVDHIIHRLKWAMVVFLISTFALIAGLVYAVYGVETVENRVEVVETSACATDPTGDECQTLLRKAAQAGNASDDCISLRRVMIPAALERFTICEP